MKLTDDLPASMIYLKGALFLLLLAASSVLVIVLDSTMYRLPCLVIVIWSSARLYYFCFYVIENYVDENYRFSGLFSFCCYLFRKR